MSKEWKRHTPARIVSLKACIQEAGHYLCLTIAPHTHLSNQSTKDRKNYFGGNLRKKVRTGHILLGSPNCWDPTVGTQLLKQNRCATVQSAVRPEKKFKVLSVCSVPLFHYSEAPSTCDICLIVKALSCLPIARWRHLKDSGIDKISNFVICIDTINGCSTARYKVSLASSGANSAFSR